MQKLGGGGGLHATDTRSLMCSALWLLKCRMMPEGLAFPFPSYIPSEYFFLTSAMLIRQTDKIIIIGLKNPT